MASNGSSTIAWAPAFEGFTGQGGFTFYSAASGYSPKTGDIVVYAGHVNIIVGFKGGQRITVGGSESGMVRCHDQEYMEKHFGAPTGYVTY